MLERACSSRLGAAALAGLWCVLLSVPADAQELDELFGSALACALAEPLLADMPVAGLYRDGDTGCELVTPGGDALAPGAWYLDAACSLPVDVLETPLERWCATLTDSRLLGEGQGLGQATVEGIGDASVWTLSPGSRLDLGARSLEGVPRPWMTRERFREVATARGTCTLEMRVYAPAPVVDGRVADAPAEPVPGGARADGRALVAFHGGSWSNRGFGFTGLELTVPHFTARGFTVFAPFYRLLGESEGSAACNAAAFEADVVVDASAALDWVRDNGARYGVSGDPVLFGQSAGGQLAARLAVDRPDEVAAAVLFYAPVDFADFVARAAGGRYDDAQGLGILESLLGVPAAEADVSASPVAENALPLRIARDGIDVPPMFLLHGDADTLVESRQSVRLCDALAGRELLAIDVEAVPTRGLREVSTCGERSALHRVAEGRHALDVCPVAVPLLPLDSCLSGSEASRERVADAIGSAAVFAADFAAPADTDPPDVLVVDDGPGAGTGSGGGGGGAASLWLLAAGALVATRRRRDRDRDGSFQCGSRPSSASLREAGQR